MNTQIYNFSAKYQVIMAPSSQPIPDLIMTILTFKDLTISQSHRRRRCQKLLIRFEKNFIFKTLLLFTFEDDEEEIPETQQEDG
jgi:hypothetical protein